MFGFDYGMEYVCSVSVRLQRELIGPLAEGIRANAHIIGGEVDGPKLRGKIRPVGADFTLLRRDGLMVLDFRATFETHDGALIYETGAGLGYGDEDLYERALKRDLPPTIPLREVIRLSTAHPDYLWVNRLQFVGIGEAVVLAGGDEVHADLYALK